MSTSEGFGRPRYGGMLRVEMRETVNSLDPADWLANGTNSAGGKLISLIFEPLVRLDKNGHLQAALAISWKHDSPKKRWRFQLRKDVTFHDGTVLTPKLAATALQALTAGRVPAVDWEPSAQGDSLVIESAQPQPDLLYDLARPSYSIFLRGANRKIFGTGPFQLTEWDPGHSIVLTANEKHWAGRPFLDSLAIQMGRPLKKQLDNLEFDNADFIEVWPNEMRRLPKNFKVWSSSNHVLIALVLKPGQNTSKDVMLREALALSINRTAINTLMQKQGEITAALLPQQLSGYAFLFPTETDTKKARELVVKSGRQQPAFVLSYDASDELARSIADRIALDAGEAGIAITLSDQPSAADIRVMHLPITTPIPGKALAALLESFTITDKKPFPATASLETLHAVEKEILSEYRVIPLLHVPELFISSPRLKTWTTNGIDPFGNCRFDDMWLETK